LFSDAWGIGGIHIWHSSGSVHLYSVLDDCVL
jgi:hypothetical protein